MSYAFSSDLPIFKPSPRIFIGMNTSHVVFFRKVFLAKLSVSLFLFLIGHHSWPGGMSTAVTGRTDHGSAGHSVTSVPGVHRLWAGWVLGSFGWWSPVCRKKHSILEADSGLLVA